MVFLDHLMKHENNAHKMREESLMCNSELAGLAGETPATIHRIERGEDCRMK